MSTEYLAMLENRDGKIVWYKFHTDSDEEARKYLQHRLDGKDVAYGELDKNMSFYNASFNEIGDISLGNLGWKVRTLVNSKTDENIWKEPTSQNAGGRKKLTKDKVVVGKKEKAVYVGPRGGRYVRANGKFVRV